MKHIEIDQKNEETIWVVRINRPPANMLTSIMIDELSMILSDFDNNKKARILILSGTGDRFFIGGADVGEIASIGSPAEGYLLAEKGQRLCNSIENLNKPVIAAINGNCLGGGNEVAISCHIRIASEKAAFQQPELNLGIIPAFGGTQRLPRIVGLGQARKLILTTEKLGAVDALACGLIDEIVANGHEIDRAMEIASVISNKSQIAVRLAQIAIREGWGKDLKDGLLLELDCFKKVCQGDEMKEALRAFKERRKPVFQR